MRTLIFGCGYLGQRVGLAWVDAKHAVYAVTRSEQKAEVLRRSGIEPIIADISNAMSLRELPHVDVVLNSLGFDRSSGQTHEEITCGGMRNILAAIQPSRLIQISSTSVYGQSMGEWVDETSECAPTQPGGLLCLEAERLAQDWALQNEGASVDILRLAGIYGPGRLLSRIEALKARTPFTGSGDSWLNLIHVDDATAAVVACSKSQVRNQTFVVVDDQPIPRATYFETLASLIGAPPPIFDPDLPRSRGSGGINKRCSNRKICDLLDWLPNFPTIETGLPAAIELSTT